MALLSDEQRVAVWAEAMRRGVAWPCVKTVLRSSLNAIDDAIEAGDAEPVAGLLAAHDAAEDAGVSGVLLGESDLADLLGRVVAARAASA